MNFMPGCPAGWPCLVSFVRSGGRWANRSRRNTTWWPRRRSSCTHSDTPTGPQFTTMYVGDARPMTTNRSPFLSADFLNSVCRVKKGGTTGAEARPSQGQITRKTDEVVPSLARIAAPPLASRPPRGAPDGTVTSQTKTVGVFSLCLFFFLL